MYFRDSIKKTRVFPFFIKNAICLAECYSVIPTNVHVVNLYSIIMFNCHHLHNICRCRMSKRWRAKSEQEHPGGLYYIFHLERLRGEHIIAFAPS